MGAFHRILVVTDLTKASAAAVARAIALARRSGAQLLIAHVYRSPALSLAEAVGPGVYDEWDGNLRNAVERQLAPLVENARRQLVCASPLALSGSPPKAIIEAARQNGADLIVVGARARQWLSRLFHWSIASRIAAAAPCRVLTVRPAPAHPPLALRLLA